MNRRVVAPFLGILLALGLFAPTLAGESEADTWLEKMIGVFAQTPLRVSWTGEMNVSIQGMQLQSTIDAHQLIGDTTHQRMSMDVKMVAPEGEMKTSVQVIYDGEFFWSETEMPMVGMRQVTRLSLSNMSALGEFGGMDLSALDPREMLKLLGQQIDFEVEEKTDSAVTLAGNFTAEAMSRMNLDKMPGLDLANTKIRMQLDAAKAHPRSMELLVDGEPFFTMNYTGIEFLESADLEKDAFDYTPPEGVPVTDLDAQLEQKPAEITPQG